MTTQTGVVCTLCTSLRGHVFKNVFAALAKWIRQFRVFVNKMLSKQLHMKALIIYTTAITQLLSSILNRQAYSSHGYQCAYWVRLIYIRWECSLTENYFLYFCLTWCQIDESFGKGSADVRLMCCMGKAWLFSSAPHCLDLHRGTASRCAEPVRRGVLFAVSWQVN